MRYVLNALAADEPDWLGRVLSDPAQAGWENRYGHRLDEGRLPRDKGERQALAEQMGRDGLVIWQAAWAGSASAAPSISEGDGVRKHVAVEVLRQVWLQQFKMSGDRLVWRERDEIPPGAALICSPYDLEARVSQKRDTVWMGYKAHLTETCDPDQPRLITQVATSPSTVNDCEVVEAIHDRLHQRDLLPAEHLMDAGYVDSRVIVSARQTYHIEVVGPLPAPPDWQAKANQGFDLAHFQVDWDRQRVVCPQAQPSTKWSLTHDAHHHPIINVRFAPPLCRACPTHALCTTSPGARCLTLRPRLQHEALLAGRAYQTTAAFKHRYRSRAGIEGTFTQADRRSGLRRSRYLGLAKTHLQHLFTAIGLNLRRAFHWALGDPLAPTRVQPFVRLPPLPSHLPVPA
jgi:transposase